MFSINFILAYIIIVIFCVLSHVFFNWHLEYYDAKLEKNNDYWKKILKRCISEKNYILKSNEIKKLKKPQMLAAFYSVFSDMPKEELQTIMIANKEKIINLSCHYKNTMMKSYFAYIISTFQINTKLQLDELNNLMIQYLLSHSVYVRENALRAIYSFGQVEIIIKAFQTLSQNNINHNEKLLSDGLITFNGNIDKLSEELMKNVYHFNVCYQVAIINFFSYKEEHRFDSLIIKKLIDNKTDVNVQCCILRCIGRVKSGENRKVLLNILNIYKNSDRWQLAAVSANLLTNYSGDVEVAKVLKDTITSKNWYVRMNSAKTLIKIGVLKEDVQLILNGDDEYAKNALTYAMNLC